jgi:hypothetical protein
MEDVADAIKAVLRHSQADGAGQSAARRYGRRGGRRAGSGRRHADAAHVTICRGAGRVSPGSSPAGAGRDALLETRRPLASLDDWVARPGLAEVFVGLNDLHLSLGCAFMFEPLAQGHLDRVAGAGAPARLGFGFGGIARLDEGLLPGRDVLAEHVRLGSRAVILSRTFRTRSDGAAALSAGN